MNISTLPGENNQNINDISEIFEWLAFEYEIMFGKYSKARTLKHICQSCGSSDTELISNEEYYIVNKHDKSIVKFTT